MQWILHPSYVADSLTAGVFLDEEAYEWGVCPSTVGAPSAVWSGACTRGRRSVQRGVPPFAGWRVYIHGNTVPPAYTLVELVQAGGGECVLVLHMGSDVPGGGEEEEKAQSALTLDSLTLVLCSSDEIDNDPILARLLAAKIRVVKPSYLLDIISCE